MSILIVEDDLDLAEVLSLILGQQGHSVRVAADGVAGLACAHERIPEVMLIDLGLPRMNGYDLGRRIRRCPHLRATQLAAMTAYPLHDDPARAQLAGFAALFPKPLCPEAFQLFLAEASMAAPAKKRSPSTRALRSKSPADRASLSLPQHCDCLAGDLAGVPHTGH